jgi:hypothetical protein
LLSFDLIGQTRKAKSQNSCTHNYIRSTEVNQIQNEMKQLQMKQILSFYFILKFFSTGKKQEKKKEENVRNNFHFLFNDTISTRTMGSTFHSLSHPSGVWSLYSDRPSTDGGAGETHQSAGDFNRISLDPFEISTGGGSTNKVAS